MFEESKMVGVKIIVHGATSDDLMVVMEDLIGNEGEFNHPLMASFSGNTAGDIHLFQIWDAKRHFEEFWTRNVEPVLRREGIHKEADKTFFEIDDLFIHPAAMDELLGGEMDDEDQEENNEESSDDSNENESEENND